MNMRNTIFLLTLLALFSPDYTFGQSEQFKFRHLNINNGLSDHEVTSIFKDSRGFIWIGTGFGLNRFDGYTVKSFLMNPQDSTSLLHNWVHKVFETPDGQLGVLTLAGPTLFNPDRETFTRNLESFYNKYGTSAKLKNIVYDPDGSYWFVEPYRLIKYLPSQKRSIVFQNIRGDTTSLVLDSISDFSLDRKGNYWIIHANGIAEKLEIRNNLGIVSERVKAVYELNRHAQASYHVLSDADGDLWIYAPYFMQGLFQYHGASKKLEWITSKSAGLRLNTDHVVSLTEGIDGTIWVGTDHGGLNVLNKKQKSVQYLLHRDEDVRSLSESTVRNLYTDDQGIIWIGTYKRGLSYYHEDIYRFDVYKHYSLDPGSLPYEDINRFAEDRNGNLWLGTNGGGLLYFDRKKGTFKQYKHDPKDPNSLSGNIIVSLWLDNEDNLWIGTYKDGLNKFDGKKFTRYGSRQGDKTSLPSSHIWELFEDSKKRFWVGTIDYGVALFDKKTGKCQRLNLYGPNDIQSPSIAAIIEDRKGRIWFGTFRGIDVLSLDGKFTHYEASAAPHSLSHNSVYDIMEDSKGRIWIATMDGLNVFDESTNKFKVYKENLPHNSVMGIREDNSGKIWISTLNGLCEITLINEDPNNVVFKHYTEADGLQGFQFNKTAAFKTRSGELLFGGPTGFNVVKPQRGGSELAPLKVIFTDLQVYQKSVKIGEEINGIVVLEKSISEATEITLPPNKTFFSVKLSALNYFNPEKNLYMYKLDNLNSEWLHVDRRSHEIAFSSLNPGKYKLRVKAANNDGQWSSNEAVLSIVIQPPFWKTKTAFTIYALVVILVLYIARKLVQQREKLKFAIEHERQEIRRVQQLDMMKVKFFTNVSHEFRTPLTLILTPIETLIKRAADPHQIVQLQLIQRNGKRLMNLVNQLLDFKKLEVQEIKLNPSKGDIISFIKETVFSFSDLAEKKHIKFEFFSTVEHLETVFDQDKLEKILFNLLSNAFKFTLENGHVSVKLNVVNEGNESVLEIRVSDTGIGIPEDKLEKIFEPFFQTDLPKSIVNQGSGIGLSITKEFIRIHGGRIKVTSEAGKGSCFIVELPVKEMVPQSSGVQIDNSMQQQPVVEEMAFLENNKPSKVKNKSLLLVEDNDDFRFYLKDNLKFLYTIYEARNGAEAWEQLLELQPDLVVTDVMMPEMNGIELCTKIKNDELTSHIPVVILTARTSEEQRLEGFQIGADDYITKPFSFEILEARIDNLLKQREKSQKTLRKTLDVKASELQITPLDVKFIENAVKCVEANVSSPEFSVEDLGMELGISRAYVYKKILALTGKSPLEFIRTIRLQHAAQLLEKSQLSVREVAYKVGFNNPKYFTKYFKEQFHVLPSQYADTRQKAAE